MALAFSVVNLLSVVVLYGRAGCSMAKNGGFRPGQSDAAVDARIAELLRGASAEYDGAHMTL